MTGLSSHTQYSDWVILNMSFTTRQLSTLMPFCKPEEHIEFTSLDWEIIMQAYRMTTLNGKMICGKLYKIIAAIIHCKKSLIINKIK